MKTRYSPILFCDFMFFCQFRLFYQVSISRMRSEMEQKRRNSNSLFSCFDGDSQKKHKEISIFLP